MYFRPPGTGIHRRLRPTKTLDEFDDDDEDDVDDDVDDDEVQDEDKDVIVGDFSGDLPWMRREQRVIFFFGLRPKYNVVLAFGQKCNVVLAFGQNSNIVLAFGQKCNIVLAFGQKCT